MQVIYLHSIAGNPGLSPALQMLADSGFEVVAPTLPGFGGVSGWEPPHDHLGWLTAVWDVLDETKALPCPVIGACIGGMFAAELAIFRPESVTALALLGPLGIWSGESPGLDPYARPGAERLSLLFAGDPPAVFLEQYSGKSGEIARYLAQTAGASAVWPIPDRDLDTRLHRISQDALLLFGQEDRVAPAQGAALWSRVAPPRLIPDAGHLLEWDQPRAVGEALSSFLAQR